MGAQLTPRPRARHQAQSRTSEAFSAHQGRQLLADLKGRADTVAGQRAFRRCSGVRGKGARALAWAMHQVVDNKERVNRSFFQEILARKLGIP